MNITLCSLQKTVFHCSYRSIYAKKHKTVSSVATEVDNVKGIMLDNISVALDTAVNADFVKIPSKIWRKRLASSKGGGNFVSKNDKDAGINCDDYGDKMNPLLRLQ